jgi:hypothetical protein
MVYFILVFDVSHRGTLFLLRRDNTVKRIQSTLIVTPADGEP